MYPYIYSCFFLFQYLCPYRQFWRLSAFSLCLFILKFAHTKVMYFRCNCWYYTVFDHTRVIAHMSNRLRAHRWKWRRAYRQNTDVHTGGNGQWYKNRRRKNSDYGYEHKDESDCPKAEYPPSLQNNYQLFGSFTVTIEDAKEYLYSISKTQPVHRFQSFKVHLYI